MDAKFDPFCHSRGSEEDDNPTASSEAQLKVEESVSMCFELAHLDHIKLNREAHSEYLKEGFFSQLLSDHYDCSRSWLIYWISSALRLLGEKQFLLDNDFKIVDFAKRCQTGEGGYSGGPNQMSHLASTYGAVNGLVSVGTEAALSSIDRVALRRFLLAMQQPDGSFTLHHGGEVDIRGAYCALSVAKLLEIPIYSDTDNELSKDGLFAKTADWLLSCQTYEGGFGALPGQEAHGGYTYCGVASLVLLDQLHRCDIDSLLRWTSNRQLKLEGGFSGRTNKLVDSCYSFWNGAVIPIVQVWMSNQTNTVFDHWWIDQEHLQKYILLCCQKTTGGLKDKPFKNADYYHTAYALAGLSIAQHSIKSVVLGDENNLVAAVHPLYNVELHTYHDTKEYFFAHPYTETKK